ncbi:MAG: DUF3887 domain-containing protein [FCB group bacterium]|jgi:dienelactone hydrolase
MKKILLILLIALLFASQHSFSQKDNAAITSELKPYVIKFFDYFKKGEVEKLYDMFDSTTKKQLPLSQLKMIAKTITFQFGKFNDIIDYNYKTVMNYDALDVKYDFERAVASFRFTFTESRKIIGFIIISKEDKSNMFKVPVYADTNSFTEHEFKFGIEGWKLPGTLSIPKGKGPFPVLILVHGSGPNDKDETIGPNKPFRDLAWGLASKGIAVFRYDKRTKVHGADFMNKIKNYTMKDEVIEDALKAVDTLKTIENINSESIFILGHSLGGFALPRIALGRSDVKGLIIMAGTTRNFEDVILEQTLYLSSLDTNNSEEKKVAIDTLRAQLKRVKDASLSMDTPTSSLPLNVGASYWLDIRGYVPAKLAKTLKQPILVIQGERDYQVTMDDYNIWKNELSPNKHVSFKLYPKLNHLFMEGIGKSKPAEYETPRNIPEYVIIDIADWIKKEIRSWIKKVK